MWYSSVDPTSGATITGGKGQQGAKDYDCMTVHKILQIGRMFVFVKFHGYHNLYLGCPHGQPLMCPKRPVCAMAWTQLAAFFS